MLSELWNSQVFKAVAFFFLFFSNFLYNFFCLFKLFFKNVFFDFLDFSGSRAPLFLQSSSRLAEWFKFG